MSNSGTYNTSMLPLTRADDCVVCVLTFLDRLDYNFASMKQRKPVFCSEQKRCHQLL